MGVDGEGGHAESLAHHDRGGLVPDPGEFLEGGKVDGDFAAMAINENFRKLGDGDRLARGKAAGPDDLPDLFHGDEGHGLRGVGEGEERGRDFVDPLVSTLGREEHGEEERVSNSKGQVNNPVQYFQFNPSGTKNMKIKEFAAK